jgi:two-component system alkaline phosphatase synthesis response regulator PhoP
MAGERNMAELVLVIEDEREIRDLIRYNLERAGYRVVAEADGDQGLERAFSSRPDAVVLDLMLPGSSGLEVLREIRSEPSTKELPVIILTARSAEMDKLLGFEHGADDYLTKPFSPKELVARLRAILRRSRPSQSAGVIESGELRIDNPAREVYFGEEKLSLTRREFDLLAFLAHHPGRVYSREELLRKVWGYDFVGETRTVDVHIRRLRKKLGEKNRVIETVTGAGYKFIATASDS